MKLLRVSALVLLIAPALMAQDNSSAALGHYGPSGVRALDEHTAFVWNIRGNVPGLWRLDTTATTVRWTPLPLPPELQQSLTNDLREQTQAASSLTAVESPFDFEVQDGTPRLLWFEDVSRNGDNFERMSKLVEAVSFDRGATWTLLSSTTSSTRGLRSVESYISTDARHAWLLARGDPGLGQLPRVLFTTNDAGRHWSAAQDRARPNPALRIGLNAPILLHALDSNRGWFVSICPACDPQSSITAARTNDSGHTWTASQISYDPQCAGCTPGSLTSTPARPDCFDLGITNNPRATQTRFCTPDVGATWNEPSPRESVAPDRRSWPRDHSLQPTYAPNNSQLGVASACSNPPAGALAQKRTPACRLVATNDGGRSWHRILPDVTADALRPVEVSAQGRQAWLLVAGEPNRLFRSSDRGTSWTSVPLAPLP